MGTLVYDGRSTAVVIDDRTLAHLRLVILAKFRRHEGFAFSWRGDGWDLNRGSVWLAPTLPLYIQFDDDKGPSINQAWVDLLMNAANSAEGLRVIPEPKQR